VSNGSGVAGAGAAAAGGGCAGVPVWASAAPTGRPKQRIQRDSPREPRAKFIDVLLGKESALYQQRFLIDEVIWRIELRGGGDQRERACGCWQKKCKREKILKWFSVIKFFGTSPGQKRQMSFLSCIVHFSERLFVGQNRRTRSITSSCCSRVISANIGKDTILFWSS
jgi:hypothetical protein